jgi:hypothetical protein
MDSIFSSYSTGENRITASLLAVVRSLSVGRIERLIGALLEQSEFQLVRFDNQPSSGAAGVPDAIIQSSICLLLETKIVRDSVTQAQIERHLERLNQSKEAHQTLLILTPDDSGPEILDSLNDDRIAWSSFSFLDQAIDEILVDPREVVSEREAFLLRELQSMLEAEGLLANLHDTVVVAARSAWNEYQKFHAYICQPNRAFQQVSRIGFYSRGVVYRLIPKILESHDDVELKRNTYSGQLGELVNGLLQDSGRKEGDRVKVLLLSAPESEDTIKLNEPIANDKRSKSGKVTAFTMGQRYVSSEKLLTARTTSDLE